MRGLCDRVDATFGLEHLNNKEATVKEEAKEESEEVKSAKKHLRGN